MLCCDGRTSHHVTWFKRLCWQTVQSDHKRVVPKAGLRTTQYLSCTECTGSSRDVKFCRRRPHSWSCTLLGLCTLDTMQPWCHCQPGLTEKTSFHRRSAVTDGVLSCNECRNQSSVSWDSWVGTHIQHCHDNVKVCLGSQLCTFVYVHMHACV